MQENLSFPEQFLDSIFKIETYRYFYRRSLGRAIFYLFCASIILAGIGGIPFLVEIHAEINEFVETITKNMPELELRNGELSVDAPMPHIVFEADDLIFVIDTTGQTDQSIMDQYESGILITKHELYFKQNRFETMHYKFSAISAGPAITRNDFVRWLPLLKLTTVFIMGIGFIVYFCGKLISALIVAAGGVVLESAAGYKIGFGNLYKLSVYALTLPMIMQTVLTLIQINTLLFSPFYYGIALLYLYRALTAIGQENADKPYRE